MAAQQVAEAREGASNDDGLVSSANPDHPANLIPALCAKFWTLGWVTGTGGGCSIREGDLVYIAPSGVQKELMKPADMYVLSLAGQTSSSSISERVYLRSPPGLKPSQCTPLFLAAFARRGARCCIHTHSQWAVLVTLILEGGGGNSRPGDEFCINNLEQIKGFRRGPDRPGNLGYHDALCVPVIENTAREEDLTEFLEAAMDRYPDAYAVLVRRHGVYVWGETVHQAKTQCESLDYLFQLAVEMHKLGLPWMTDIEPVKPTRS